MQRENFVVLHNTLNVQISNNKIVTILKKKNIVESMYVLRAALSIRKLPSPSTRNPNADCGVATRVPRRKKRVRDAEQYLLPAVIKKKKNPGYPRDVNDGPEDKHNTRTILIILCMYDDIS